MRTAAFDLGQTSVMSAAFREICKTLCVSQADEQRRARIAVTLMEMARSGVRRHDEFCARFLGNDVTDV